MAKIAIQKSTGVPVHARDASTTALERGLNSPFDFACMECGVTLRCTHYAKPFSDKDHVYFGVYGDAYKHEPYCNSAYGSESNGNTHSHEEWEQDDVEVVSPRVMQFEPQTRNFPETDISSREVRLTGQQKSRETLTDLIWRNGTSLSALRKANAYQFRISGQIFSMAQIFNSPTTTLMNGVDGKSFNGGVAFGLARIYSKPAPSDRVSINFMERFNHDGNLIPVMGKLDLDTLHLNDPMRHWIRDGIQQGGLYDIAIKWRESALERAKRDGGRWEFMKESPQLWFTDIEKIAIKASSGNGR
ncbi:MAG: hypothetical protein WAZ18_03605 [Alphaproteobacteria bacterium]